MKIRVRTVKTGDFRPREFPVPEDVAVAGGMVLSKWVQSCVHGYRSEMLETASEIKREDGDTSIVTDYINKQRVEEAGKGLTG